MRLCVLVAVIGLTAANALVVTLSGQVSGAANETLAPACSQAFELVPIRKVDVEDGWLQWVDYSPDGKWLATCGDRWLHYYDASTGRLVGRLGPHDKPVVRFAFSPDGTQCATASKDNKVRVWDVAEEKLLSTYRDQQDSIVGVAFSSDGQLLASAAAFEDGTIDLWTLAEAKRLGRAQMPERDNAMFLAWSTDQQTLIASSYRGRVRVYDCDQDLQLKLRFDRNYARGEMIPHCQFVDDDECFVASSWDRTLRKFRLSDGQELWKVEAPEGERCFELCRVHRITALLFSATRGGIIQVRHPEDGSLLAATNCETETLRGLAIHPLRDEIASVGHDGKLRVYSFDRTKIQGPE